jgi:hypothetical protein
MFQLKTQQINSNNSSTAVANHFESGQKPVPGQNNSTNPTSKFGAGITGYVGANRAAQVAAGSSKAEALMLLSESKFLQAEAVQRGF